MQQIIKYSAISLAILLIIGIFYTILSIISNIFGFTLYKDNSDYKMFEITNDIKELDIEIKTSKLTLKKDLEFKIESNNSNVKIKENGNKLIIEEKNNIFNVYNDEIIIYIPETKSFNNVFIEAGSGKIDIDYINANVIDFELGAGNINITDINIREKATIETGAGSLVVDNGVFINLDLDLGVGKAIINTDLLGNTDIDAGIGDLEINLNNNINNYNLIVEKGIGDIKINGESVNNGYVSGTGSNKIEIDGGIGNININSKYLRQ